MLAREAGYVPALTGLRGVAAWWVVLYHFSDPLVGLASPWVLAVVRNGYLAVDLFFILSGYVIYITSGESLRTLGRWVVSRFLLNRIIRIYPLHLAMMIIYLVNPLALWLFSSSGDVGEGRYDFGYYVASVFLVQNWGVYDVLQWNVPAWSISTEFAAYLLCPLLVALCVGRLSASFWKLVSMVALLAVLVGLIFSAFGLDSIGEKITSLGLVRCVLEFWMGLCLGAASRFVGLVSNRWRIFNSVIIFVLVLFSVFLGKIGIPNYWFVPAVCALLILVLSRGDFLFSGVLSFAWIHYLGVISYSTYLVHFFIKDWVKFLSESVGGYQFFFYVSLVFFVSMALYRYVEEPARRFLRRRLIVKGVP